METEKRLIDANALCSRFEELADKHKPDGDLFFLDSIIDEILDAPEVDAVEVVRCKNCYLGENCTCVCCEDGEMVYCRKNHKHMDANAFCSDGWRE